MAGGGEGGGGEAAVVANLAATKTTEAEVGGGRRSGSVLLPAALERRQRRQKMGRWTAAGGRLPVRTATGRGAAGRHGRCGGRQRRSGGVGRRPPFTRGRRLRPYQFRLLGPLDTVPWPVVPGRVPGRAPSDRPQPAAPWLQSRSTTLSTIWSEPSRPMPPHLTPGSVVTSPISPPSPALFGLWRAPCRILSCSARAPRRGLQVGHQFSSPFLLRPPLSGGQHCLHRHCAGDAALVGPGRRNAAP